MASECQHWLTLRTKEGKEIDIPRVCLNFNPDTEEFEDNGCPYCKTDSRTDISYYANAIIRELQEQEPRKKRPPSMSETKRQKFGDISVRFKDTKSRTWTPVRVIKMTGVTADKIVSIGQDNRYQVKNPKTGRKVERQYPVSDPRYGQDILIKFLDEGKYGKYEIRPGEQSSLSKEERSYLVYNMEPPKPDKLADARRDFDDLKKKLVIQKEDEGASGKKRRKSSKEDIFDEHDEESYVEDDWEDDEEEVRSNRKSSRNRKRKRSRSDGGDSFSDLEKDIDRRARRKKSRPKSSTRSKTRSKSKSSKSRTKGRSRRR